MIYVNDIVIIIPIEKSLDLVRSKRLMSSSIRDARKREREWKCLREILSDGNKEGVFS